MRVRNRAIPCHGHPQAGEDDVFDRPEVNATALIHVIDGLLLRGDVLPGSCAESLGAIGFYSLKSQAVHNRIINEA
jgi:hypothetical protein